MGVEQGPDRADHPAVSRVLAVLAAFGHTPQIRHLPDAVRTAKAAAEALGITPAEIANSLVFAADAGDGTSPVPLLVLSSGGHRVDTIKIADTLECAPLRQATPEEAWRQAQENAIADIRRAGVDL